MPWIRANTFQTWSKSVVRMSALLSRSWSNRCPDRCLVTIGFLRGRMGVVTQPPPCLLRTAFVASKSPINAVGNGLDYGQTINRTMDKTHPRHAEKKGQALCLPSLEGVVIPVEKKGCQAGGPDICPPRASPKMGTGCLVSLKQRSLPPCLRQSCQRRVIVFSISVELVRSNLSLNMPKCLPSNSRPLRAVLRSPFSLASLVKL